MCLLAGMGDGKPAPLRLVDWAWQGTKVGCSYHNGEQMLERPNQQVSTSKASRRGTVYETSPQAPA